MKIRNISKFLCLYVCLIMFPISHGQAQETADNNGYAGLLKKYVKNGAVNYRGLKDEEAVLDKYLDLIEKTDSKSLSRNEQFAFYINAYNAWTLKLVLGAYPGIKSIKDSGGALKGPWKKEICRIDGKVITLDDLEHAILRPRFEDPRVHFAICSASKSCPVLISELYRADILNDQLDAAARSFISDPQKNRLEGNTLYLSSLFKWFADDFNNDVIGFFLKYAEGNLKEKLRSEKDKLTVTYFDYDWSLNGE